MASSTAFVFPGQGSQAIGMGRKLVDRYPVARAAVDEADAALGFSLSRLMWEGPRETLRLTQNAQPAILTISIAAMRVLQASSGVIPRLAAGHSLGEWSALVAAGVLSFQDALRAVRIRGQLMQEAVAPGGGAMAAVIGLDAASVERGVRSVSSDGAPVAVAGYNTPEQITISGAAVAVQRASDELVASGATRVLPLPVSAPFHSPMMRPVEAPLRAAISELDLGEFAFPVVSNVEATANTEPNRVVDLLIRQLSSPVRWVESVESMVRSGVTTFIELGSGHALADMVRKIDNKTRRFHVEDPDSLARTLEGLR